MSVGEVAAQLAVEVRCDVGVGAVDAGVDDADEHVLAPALLAGTSRSGVASIICMSHCSERGGRPLARATVLARTLTLGPAFVLDGVSALDSFVRRVPDRRVAGDAGDAGLRRDVGDERRVRRRDGDEADRAR